MDINSSTPAADPVEQIREQNQEPAAEPKRKPLRYNPRLVFADPDLFFLLLEQNEQQ
jgi:hypothetical protein